MARVERDPAQVIKMYWKVRLKVRQEPEEELAPTV